MKKYPDKKDGFLVIGDQYSLLVTDESKQVARGSSKNLMDLWVGDKFSLEMFRGELLEDYPVEQFTSGVCFLNLQVNVDKKDYKKKKKLN